MRLLLSILAACLASGEAAAAPDNDDFADAAVIAAAEAVIAFDTRDATKEPGEPHHAGQAGGRSVWWRWTPQADGGIRIRTTAETFNFHTLLAVYTGDAVGALTLVAENFQAPNHSPADSEVIFTVTAGTIYHIAVDGFSGGAGDGVLELATQIIPANDAFAGAIVIPPAGGAYAFDTSGASREAGEPEHNGSSVGHSLWWRWTPVADTPVRIMTVDDNFASFPRIYTGETVSTLTLAPVTYTWNDGVRADVFGRAGTTYHIAVDGSNGEYGTGTLTLAERDRPVNDDFADAIEIPGIRGVFPFSNHGAGDETGEPSHNQSFGGRSVWWSWTPGRDVTVALQTQTNSFQTYLAVYTGEAVDALTLVTRDGANQAGGASRVFLDATGGVTYRIAVDARFGAEGEAELALIPRPGNDDFADAFPLSALEGVHPFTLIGASTETGEPSHAGGFTGSSVWWAWTPPADAGIRIQTQNNDHTSRLAVYTGDAVDELSLVAGHGDNPDFVNASRVEFAAVAGETYRIAAANGFGPGSAELAFSVLGAPANDAIGSAVALAAGGGSRGGQNLNATKAGGEPSHGGDAGGASVWYTWTPGASGPARVDTDGSTFDTLLAVYTSPDGGATLNLVGQNDDIASAPSATAGSSAVAFAANSGVTYYIAVDGKAGASGAFRLTHRINGPADDRRLRSAVLPQARAVRLGEAASAFATVINPAATGIAATNCRIEAPLGFNGALSFNTTDPDTNAANGTQNQPVPIASGAAQTFVFALFPGEAMNGVEVEPVFICDQIGQPLTVTGVTTLTVTATEDGTADVIAIAATLHAQGAVAPVNGATAFSVAGVNIGEAAEITVRPAPPEGVILPLTLTICESDPGTGICLAPRTPSVTVDFANGQTRTFSVRVGGQGSAVAFTPATNRVVVTFEDDDSGVVAGSTSVAVQTTP